MTVFNIKFKGLIMIMIIAVFVKSQGNQQNKPIKDVQEEQTTFKKSESRLKQETMKFEEFKKKMGKKYADEK